MSSRKCKIFLISTMTYDSSGLESDIYIDVLRNFVRKYPDVESSRVHLDGTRVNYEESGGLPNLEDVSAFEAIDRARGFSMCASTEFGEPDLNLEAVSEDFSVDSVKSNLFYDSHGCFCIIYEIVIQYSEDMVESDLLKVLFKGRDSIPNLGLQKYRESRNKDALKIIEEIVAGQGIKLSGGSLKFEVDNTLPFIVFPDACDIDRSQFKNEESLSGFKSGSNIALDYEGSFFYPGWNYTIASGLPVEVLLNLTQMLIRAQTFFFNLGYMKSYFSEELGKTIKNKEVINERKVDSAEEVRLAFYDLVSKFNTYKNKLFPKYHKELSDLLERWHCNDDVVDIKEYIELDLQSKDRIHTANIERQNERQNRALIFIALIQLISIYGAFSDGEHLFTSDSTLFILGTFTWVSSLLVFLLVSKFYRWAILFSIFTAVSLFGLKFMSSSGIRDILSVFPFN